MRSITIEIEFVDGTKLQFTTSTYGSLTDRVAFERRYQISFRRLQNQVKEESEDAMEEHALFLVWRAANRHQDQGPFDAWVEKVADFNLIDPDAPAGANGQVPDPTNAVMTPQ